jgi:hypothetical protein
MLPGLGIHGIHTSLRLQFYSNNLKHSTCD